MTWAADIPEDVLNRERVAVLNLELDAANAEVTRLRAELTPPVGSEVREEWGVDCPIEGFVACDSEHDARAWLVPNGAHHPGQPDVLMRRTTTAWQVAE